MKDGIWFSHDANARHDTKHIEMMSVYGWEGYGWYWMIVEMMRESKEYKLSCSKKTFYVTLSKLMETDEKIARQYMKDCVEEFCLFNTDGEHFWADTLLERMEIKDNLSAKRSEIGSKGAARRWQSDGKTNGKGNAGAMANVKQTDARVSKEINKRKENESKRDSKPEEFETWEEYLAERKLYCKNPECGRRIPTPYSCPACGWLK